MGKKCTSSCPYYGVDENYNGYCKKDHNSYRERFSDCKFEKSTSSSTSSSTSYSSQKSEPRTCSSSCPYYGVDENDNGYCKKDHNSYRERYSTCNMGETKKSSSYSGSSSSGSSSSSSGSGVFKKLIIFIVILIVGGMILINYLPAVLNILDFGVSDGIDNETEQKTVAYVSATSGLNLRDAASTNSNVITLMENNAEVIVKEISGDWAYVDYNGQYGWCYTQYLNIQD